VEEIELLRSERLNTKATLEADLYLAKSRMDQLKAELHQLEMSVSQIKSKQAKKDDVVKALEEELEVVKSTDVVDDMDVEALNKIKTILGTERSNLKDLKWM
jgi:septal ring factor EnvC (AmiA/AmiB activator)